jgi:2'-deoxynucleoside 5'-phosphate N-hydrolase
MKIYFAGSIRGGREDSPAYNAIITYLRSFGEVLTEHVGDPALSQMGDDGADDRYIHDRDMAWLYSCDVVVAEVSAPSLGVGYEIGLAVSLKKPILCLYRPMIDRPLSAMIAGSPGIKTAGYGTFEEAKGLIEDFIRETHGYPP